MIYDVSIGPLAGGPFPSDQPNPRSVNVEYFEKVCPFDRRTRLSIKELNEGLEGRPVIEVVEKYAAKLLAMTEGCVELYGDLEHPFDWMLVQLRFFDDVALDLIFSLLILFFCDAPAGTLATSRCRRSGQCSRILLYCENSNGPSLRCQRCGRMHPHLRQSSQSTRFRTSCRGSWLSTSEGGTTTCIVRV